MGVYYNPFIVSNLGSTFQSHFGIHRNPLVMGPKHLSLHLHRWALVSLQGNYILSSPLRNMRTILLRVAHEVITTTEVRGGYLYIDADGHIWKIPLSKELNGIMCSRLYKLQH